MITTETHDSDQAAMSEKVAVSTDHATSGGELTSADYLDDHYAAMQPEYEQMLRRVGLLPGWRVLDAGCGGGSYLPLLAELLGPEGQIVASDIAPENIQRVAQRIGRGEFACAVEARVADVTMLPFPDASFDGLWCAAVSEYLTDAQLLAAFAEFRRVVRPGGLIAVKEHDFTAVHWEPLPNAMIWRWLRALESTTNFRGVFRAPEFPGLYRGLGLEQIVAYTVIGERRNPLTETERRYLRIVFEDLSAGALTLDLPDEDLARWRVLMDVDHPDHILQHEDFRHREGSTVVVGRVPVT